MEENRLSYLFYKVIDGTATDAEKHELAELSVQPEHVEALRELMQEGWETFSPEAPVFTEMQSAAMLKKSLKKPDGHIRQLPVRRWWWAAAAAVLLFGVGTYYWSSTQQRQHISQHADIGPGKDGAILTLGDGEQVVLDSLGNGLIALQNGTQAIIKNGVLEYNATGESTDAIVYNTIRTPKGRQFSITLPDGTKVWLNAASSLRFPTAFSATERNVEVTGEAYFEVAKLKAKPFRVNVNNKMHVEVLGTHFNINAYDSDAEIYTTLLEGKVQVVKDQQQVILKPGQQAQTDKGIQVTDDVDMERVMAWKQGLFYFDGVRIPEVMKQLERWYDIEVVYENGIPDIDLMGKMTRGVTLQGLLGGLERLGVRYRLEGRKLIILK